MLRYSINGGSQKGVAWAIMKWNDLVEQEEVHLDNKTFLLTCHSAFIFNSQIINLFED